MFALKCMSGDRFKTIVWEKGSVRHMCLYFILHYLLDGDI